MQQTTVYKLTPVQSEVESTHVARVVIIASKTQVDRWSLVSSPFFSKERKPAETQKETIGLQNIMAASRSCYISRKK